MEIKKFEQEVIEETPVVEETVEQTIEETPEENVTEKITKFDEYKPVEESIQYYEDLTLEQKVENLEQRLRNIESRIG